MPKAHQAIAMLTISTSAHHNRLQIPNAGAAALDDVFDSQNKRHVEVYNERRTKCDEGGVNKEKSDLR
jgi:hypothetical protein